MTTVHLNAINLTILLFAAVHLNSVHLTKAHVAAMHLTISHLTTIFDCNVVDYSALDCTELDCSAHTTLFSVGLATVKTDCIQLTAAATNLQRNTTFNFLAMN